SLVRDRTGYDLVAVDQIAGAPSRPGADVVVYGDTQVLDDYQFANLDGDGIFDNYEFAYNLVWWKPANQPPVAVLQPSSVQTIYEGQSAYFSGYGSYDPDPVVDMVFVVDSSPSMPGEWNILSVILPQIEANLTAEGYDLEFVVLGLDHGTETPTKFPIMDAWLDYGARLDASGNIFQDCVRNTQISNPNGYNVNTANPSPGLIDPSKRCDHYSTHNSEGWAQGAAFVAENRTWREGATRIIVPIGDSAPWTQLGDGSPGKQFMGRPFVTYLDWLIIDETSEILNDNGVVAFPMYDESIDPDGAGPLVGVQQELFISMGEQTGGVAFPIDDAQGFMDNVIALIESVILQFSWDFDASVDLDLDGDYINDNEATGMNVSHTYYDDCDCVVTLTVTDVGGAWSQVQASVKVLNVAPSVQWSSRAEDGSALQPPYPEGMKVLFTSIVFDPGIYDTHTYDWDFGDGTILLDAGPSVTHAYGDNFTYVVVLKVTDDDGGIGIDDTPPLLTTNEDTVPSISVPFCIFLEGTYPCELIGEFTDPGWLDTHSGVWNFGDGEYETASITEENDPPDSTGISFTSHLYGDNGEFNVTFTVVDDDGGWGVASARVEILNLPPSSTVDVPSTVDEGDGFILGLVATDPGSDDIIVNIDWGDGDSEMETFYNDGVGPDPPNSGPGVFPFTIYANYSHVYGDDGNYT
ncbi:MAG: PKD domain-containing protein, partial [Thermoplasmata archaeon]|nr:PKD domain-containing protein [Thermoplasmata archaeon]